MRANKDEKTNFSLLFLELAPMEMWPSGREQGSKTRVVK